MKKCRKNPRHAYRPTFAEHTHTHTHTHEMCYKDCELVKQAKLIAFLWTYFSFSELHTPGTAHNANFYCDGNICLKINMAP